MQKQIEQKRNTGPTRPRIDIVGYHHIINRGVGRMNIFHHFGLSKSVIFVIIKSDKSGDER